MVGVAFGQCGRFQQCRLRNDFRVDGRDGEAAFGQRTGLVEDDGTDTGQCFQMVGPFYENPFAGCTSYAGEKGERDGYHEGTGTGDDQKDESPVEPYEPIPSGEQEWDDCQQKGGDAAGGGVIAGEPGDEFLGGGLARVCVLYQVEDAGYRRFAVNAGRPYPEQAGHVEAAAEDDVVFGHLLRQAFARKGCGVECG